MELQPTVNAILPPHVSLVASRFLAVRRAEHARHPRPVWTPGIAPRDDLGETRGRAKGAADYEVVDQRVSPRRPKQCPPARSECPGWTPDGGSATTATASRGRKIRRVVDLEVLEYSRLEDDLEALEAHGDHADTLREIVWIYSWRSEKSGRE